MPIIFNGTSFRNPNEMEERPKILRTNEARSINNTLTKDIWNFTSKKEFILTYTMLTLSEFNSLMGFVDAGAIPVSSNITNHTFSFTNAHVSLESKVNHGLAGYRKDLKIVVKEV